MTSISGVSHLSLVTCSVHLWGRQTCWILLLLQEQQSYWSKVSHLWWFWILIISLMTFYRWLWRRLSVMCDKSSSTKWQGCCRASIVPQSMVDILRKFYTKEISLHLATGCSWACLLLSDTQFWVHQNMYTTLYIASLLLALVLIIQVLSLLPGFLFKQPSE